MRKSLLLLIVAGLLVGQGFAEDSTREPVVESESGFKFDKVLDIAHGGRTYRLQLHEVNHILSPDFRFLMQVPKGEADKAKKAGAEIFVQGPLSYEYTDWVTKETTTVTVTTEPMYYIVNPEIMTKFKPDFFFGKVEDRPGWSVAAIRKPDGGFNGRVYSERGYSFTFTGYGIEGEGNVRLAPRGNTLSSMDRLIPFYSREQGGVLRREHVYRADMKTPDLLEYDLVMDSTANTREGGKWQQWQQMPQEEREEQIEAKITRWLGCYVDIAAINTRDLLIPARLKTFVYRLDDKVNPFPDKASLKLSLIAMWDKDHHKGITGCSKFGSANAMRGGFACQLRSIPGKTLHEHNHCLGGFHGILLTEENGAMNGAGTRICALTALVCRGDCKEKLAEGNFRRTEPIDYGLPPYAAFDQAYVKRGQVEPLEIDVLANDFVSSGAPIELVGVEPLSSRGQPVKMNNGKVEYTAPTGWIGTDNLSYTIRAKAFNGWLYARGVVNVDVHTWLSRHEVEDMAAAESVVDARPETGCFGAKYAVVKAKGAESLPENETNAAASVLRWKVNAPEKGYYGLGIRYHHAPEFGTDDPELELIVAGQTLRLNVPLERFGQPSGGAELIERLAPPAPAKYDKNTGKLVKPAGTLRGKDRGNITKWGVLKVPGLELPAGEHEVQLRVVKGGVQLDSVYFEEGLNLQVNFEAYLMGRKGEPHFFIDLGESFGPRPYAAGRFKYGWLTAVGDPLTKQFLLEGSPRTIGKGYLIGKREKWAIELPNGTYHVSVFCGDPLNRFKQINTIEVNGESIQDEPGKGKMADGHILGSPVVGGRRGQLEPTLDFNGDKIFDPVDYFMHELEVTEGKLEITRGDISNDLAALLNPSISYIEIAEIVDDTQD